MTQTRAFSPTRFDRTVLLIMLGLIAAIALTILLGDHVGVQVLRTAPGDQARSTSWITLQFSEPMDRDSVAARLTVEPPLDGDLNWNGPTLAFRPSAAMQPGETYTVRLAAGALSATGRAVLDDHSFSFTVRSPRIAYLAPANGTPQNIWVVDPQQPEDAAQLTFSEAGIFNFDVSPDGAQIAYAEHDNATGTINLHVLDLASGETRQLTDCTDADCTTPVWSPDGRTIAYERMDFNRDFSTLGASPTRVWLLDVSADPPTTRPLINDSQVVGYAPTWSPDGEHIAIYDSNSPGILIYNLDTEAIQFIPSRHGSMGAFSPDGTQFIYPDVVITESGARTHMSIADLETLRITPLNEPGDPVDDERAQWAPDGASVAVGRRYLDDRYTPGRQVYRLNLASGEVSPLLVDDGYYNGYFEWHPTGVMLVVQRFPQPGGTPANSEITPEVWTIDVARDTLTQIATNAFLPQWIP